MLATDTEASTRPETSRADEEEADSKETGWEAARFNIGFFLSGIVARLRLAVFSICPSAARRTPVVAFHPPFA